MLATQTEVSDGTLNIVNVGIEFFEQNDISVTLGQFGDPLVEGVDYVWSAATSIQFLNTVGTPAGLVPVGVEVVLRRNTKNDEMYNVYDGGAPFSRLSLDENYEQLLFLSQEFSEGLGLDGLRNNLNMNGYRILNVGDPQDAGDATNKGYVDTQDGFNVRTPEQIPALPSAGTRANKVMGFNSLGNPIATLPESGSGTELAIDLANASDPDKGAGMVGFVPGLTVADLATPGSSTGGQVVSFLADGTGAVPRFLQGKAREWVSAYDYGAVDDGVTDAGPGIAAAKASPGKGGYYRLTKRSGGTYRVTTPVNLNGSYIDNDPGLVISTTEAQFPITNSGFTRVSRPLRLYYSNQNYSYTLYPQATQELAEKDVWLTEADYDYSYQENFDLSTLASLRHEMISWPSGDTWTAASNVALGNNGGNYPYLNWSSGVASTWYRSSFPVREGDEVVASFDTPGQWNRAAFVQHATGYFVLYATGVNGALNYGSKITGGGAATQNSVGTGEVVRTQPQYYGENAEWTIRIISKRKFVFMLNGVQVSQVQTAPSDIQRAAFGYMPVGAITAVSIGGFVRTRKGKASGRPNETITVYGDSMSAPIHGGWPEYFRKVVEGASGTTIDAIANLAVPGYTAAQVYAAMQANGYAGRTVFICASTNDIQGQTGVPALMATYEQMFTHAQSFGQRIIVWIPPMWYTQAEAVAAGMPAGTGQASGNAINGANYRVNLERLCAKWDIKCVNMTKHMGPADAKYLTAGTGADTNLRDNIHLTPYAYKKAAFVMGCAYLGAVGASTRRREAMPLPITLAGGVTNDVLTPGTCVVTSDGVAQLAGKGNTVASGSVIATLTVGTLREDLWPVVPVNVPCRASTGNCVMSVDQLGVVRIEQYPANAVWFDYSCVTMITNY